MYRWIVKQLMRFALARLRGGDPRIFLALAAMMCIFGSTGSTPGLPIIDPRIRRGVGFSRYLGARLELQPHEIVVSGPPWNTMICTRFTDRATDASGCVIYESEGILFDRLRWGRIRQHISYEDTQRTLDFDRKLGVAAAP